ncbi:hypothetical protein [Brevundimonas sp.]|uniref:hypothetical protein n=1 Tax=Brevundimonas sp. TaxID=1871086 RepID=UPI0028AA0AB3|nr:hypothetical protein [Brevundimonas sp.]
MTTTSNFLAKVDAAQAVLGHTDSYLSRLIFDDGKVVARLRSGTGSVTIARLEKATAALAALLSLKGEGTSGAAGQAV